MNLSLNFATFQLTACFTSLPVTEPESQLETLQEPIMICADVLLLLSLAEHTVTPRNWVESEEFSWSEEAFNEFIT